jgi:hypothetical protein
MGRIRNCEVIEDDVNRGEQIYGPMVPLIDGKMVRHKPKHVINVPRVPLPPLILKRSPTDELDMDFFLVN